MPRILFVDDEVVVLEALRRILKGTEWDAKFAATAVAAMTELRQGPFDVVVSDLYMVPIDGVAFLSQVRAEFPHIVRVMWSGVVDSERTLRAAGVAQQFLSRPTSFDALRQMAKRLLAARAAMSNEAVVRLIGRMEKVPSVPETYVTLVELLQQGHVPLSAIVEVIERDAALTAKVLHLANAAFFGHAQLTRTVMAAVQRVGLNTLRNLVLAAELFEDLSVNPLHFPDLQSQIVLTHTMAVAKLAATLDQTASWRDDAFVGGLLHDFGKLLLATRLPDQYECVVRAARQSGRPLHDVESEMLDVTHADVAAYLMELWHLPPPVIEAVRMHHTASVLEPGVLTAQSGVFLANLLIHRWQTKDDRGATALTRQLTELGFGPHANAWVEMTENICGSGSPLVSMRPPRR